MAKKSQSTPTFPASPAGGGSSTSGVARTQSAPSNKKSKRAAQTPQAPKALVKQAATKGSAPTSTPASTANTAQAPKAQATSKKKKKTKATPQSQPSLQSLTQSCASKQGVERVANSKATIMRPSESSASRPTNIASLTVHKVSTTMKSDDLGADCQAIKLQCDTVATEALSNLADREIFRLAAATPVPISPVVERQFYESQLLLYVLEKVRGDHSKRQNYHGELDQDSTELRRSFVDKLAYICDFRKGGSTVTALALQKTYQGVTFWLAANETVKPKVIEFLRQVLRILKQAEDGVSKKAIERQIMALIVPFNKERLDYYWSALDRDLDLCVERLELLESSPDVKPPQKGLTCLKNLLGGLRKVSVEKVELVRECFDARKSTAFETLAQLTASGKANSKFFDDIRHLLGRLGEHLKAAKTIISAALRFPAILDDFEIHVRTSPPSRCYFQSHKDITLDGMASRIFSKENEITHYQEALRNLERTSNGALLGRLKEECCFKTRVHAELLLADLFYWKQFEFLDDDQYIGCSKPACYNCFQYILAHPGNFTLPACHNKLYLAWRTPDILTENASATSASRIREAITNKISSNIRAELRRQIDGRCAKKPPQYDSVTGTSSSIQGGSLRPLAGISQGESNPSQNFPTMPLSRGPSSDSKINQADDSDDDLSWYKSRVQQLRLI